MDPAIPPYRPAPWFAPAKRATDIFGAGCGLVLLLPVYCAVAVLIAVDSRGPVIHRRRVLARQEYCVGDALVTFDAFKFRTMIPGADEWLQDNPAVDAEYQEQFKLRNDPRVTRIGSFLRRSSLDELPQLVNILRGQMTLVGPRIITPAELRHYEDDAAKLLAVTPGLTGYWQVSGRSDTSYAERARLDMWYIDHRSLWLDLIILVRTVGVVLKRYGAR